MDPNNFFREAPANSGAYSSRQAFTSYSSFSSQYSRSSRLSNSTRHRPPPSCSQPSHTSTPALPLIKPSSVTDECIAKFAATSHAPSILPTPPSSDAARSSPPAEQDPSREDHDPHLRDFKIPPPPLHGDDPELSMLTHAYLDQQLAKREGSLFLRHISPQMFHEWESLHPTLQEDDNTRYEYDSSMSRMIVKCMPGPIHDSVQGYFIKRVAATMDRLGGDACEDLIEVNCGTDFKGFTGDYAYGTRKQPDAYVQINDGSAFPTIVVETGWSEDFEDLRDDARLWLLGTGLMTKVVIVVSFTEITGVDEAHGEPDDPMDDDAQTNEQAVLDHVSDSTKSKDLAYQLLELHRCGQLSRPLLGRLHSTLHVFRRDASETQVIETFSATVLPAPDHPGTELDVFDLTIQDVFGDSTIPPAVDPNASITFSIERLRGVIARQIPKMERHRAIARAEDVMKKKGFAEQKQTYAVLKKNRGLGELWD